MRVESARQPGLQDSFNTGTFEDAHLEKRLNQNGVRAEMDLVPVFANFGNGFAFLRKYQRMMSRMGRN